MDIVINKQRGWDYEVTCGTKCRFYFFLLEQWTYIQLIYIVKNISNFYSYPLTYLPMTESTITYKSN